MPIYEYRCADCGFQNEYLQKVSEPPMTLCPSCGNESFRKLLTAAGFQLKGSGWYATDFKGGKPAAEAKAGSKEGGAAAGDGAKGEAQSETKPASGDKSGEAKSDKAKSDSAPAAPATASGN